jgi:hypothetical protein
MDPSANSKVEPILEPIAPKLWNHRPLQAALEPTLALGAPTFLGLALRGGPSAREGQEDDFADQGRPVPQIRENNIGQYAQVAEGDAVSDRARSAAVSHMDLRFFRPYASMGIHR